MTNLERRQGNDVVCADEEGKLCPAVNPAEALRWAASVF